MVPKKEIVQHATILITLITRTHAQTTTWYMMKQTEHVYFKSSDTYITSCWLHNCDTTQVCMIKVYVHMYAR